MSRQRGQTSYEYDVCISFAGKDRAIAEKIAKALKRGGGCRVFYDDFEKRALWGKDLFRHLFDVYSKKSRLCIILFSRSYLVRNWTNHELRAAQLRTLSERREYILPVKVGPCNIPQEFENIAHLNLKTDSIRDIIVGVAMKTGERIEEEGWIPEGKLVEKMNEEILNDAIVNAFRTQLIAEHNPRKALAKALCSLIFLCQGLSDGALSAYMSYLVVQFRPLSHYFDRDDCFHVLNGKGGAMRRALNSKSGYNLLMKSEFLKKRVAEWHVTYADSKQGKVKRPRLSKSNANELIEPKARSLAATVVAGMKGG